MFKTFLQQHDLSAFTFRGDLFPTVEDRDFWESFQNDTCIAEAEQVIDYDWPIIKATDFMTFKSCGDRDTMRRIHISRRNHLVLFALAELKENTGRFLPQLVNGLFTICEETFWGISAHWYQEIGNIPSAADPYVDLYAAETAANLAIIITLLREPLASFCPEIIERVEYELNRRIQTPYETHLDYFWMAYNGRRASNWNPWILSNVLTVYLLTEKDPARLEKCVRKIMTEAQHYYDSVSADGGCDEGSHYWTRAGASLFEIVYQLKCATNGALNLFGDQKLGLIASYMQKAHVAGDIFVNVADSHIVGNGNMMPLLYGFAKETKQPELLNFSVEVYRSKTGETSPLSGNTLRRVIYNSQFIRQMQAHTVGYPIHKPVEHLPVLELAVLREGNWVLATKGGFNNELHNHNDVGSFALYENSTPVLVDVGISSYTRFNFELEHRYSTILWPQSAYHNLPMVNGAQQQYGDQYRSDYFRVSRGQIETAFPKAYGDEAKLLQLTRDLTLSADGLQLTDRFQFSQAGSNKVCQVLMSILPVQLVKNTAILDGRYRISASTGTFRAEQVFFDDPQLCADWKANFVTRILLDCQDTDEICIKVEKL